MIIKTSKVIHIREDEEEMIDDIIQYHEQNEWKLLMKKQLIDDGSDIDITWMLGFGKTEEI